MIKNLQLQLNEAGKIKIGIKGDTVTTKGGKDFRLPQKIDHFILTTTEKSESGDFLPDNALMDRIKENNTGMLNEQGNLVGIPIRLLYDDIEQNFPTRYACYNGKNCSCYGDGEKAFKRLDDYKKEYPCPCQRLEPEYEGKDCCKPNGRLICMIDEAGLFGQAHVFRTTSINSIKGICAGMELIKVATKGRIAGLPLMLVLTTKQTDYGPVYIASVCYRGTMDALRDSVRELALKERDYLLEIPQATKPTVVTPGTEEELDFVEEFYPDAAMDSSEPETETTPDQEEGISAEPEPESVPEPKPEPDTADIPEEAKKPEAKATPGQEEKIPEEAKPHILDDQSSYGRLYNRFIIAVALNKKEDAAKFAKRMTREYLISFFENVRPEIKLPEPPRKPELLDLINTVLNEATPLVPIEPFSFEAEKQQEEETGQDQEQPQTTEAPSPEKDPNDETVPPEEKTKQRPEVIAFFEHLSTLTTQKEVADAMEEAFAPLPINRSLDRLGLLTAAKKLVDQGHFDFQNPERFAWWNPTTPGSLPVRQTAQNDPAPEREIKGQSKEQLKTVPFDPADPIEREQLKTLVQIKTKLERAKITQPEEWSLFVATYPDKSGNPASTARDLSRNQGDDLIEKLNSRLPENERVEYDMIPF